MRINPNVALYYVTYFSDKNEISAYKRFAPKEFREELKRLGYEPRRILFYKGERSLNIGYYKNISVMERPIWFNWNLNNGINNGDLEFINKRLGLPVSNSLEQLKEIMASPFRVKVMLANEDK